MELFLKNLILPTALFDNLRLIIVILDEDGFIRYVNPFFCESTGYARKEVDGQSWFEKFLPDENIETVMGVFRDVLAKEEYVHFDNTIIRKDGTKMFVSWTNSVLREKDGKSRGTLSLGMDISGHKEMEDELRRSEELYRALAESTLDMVYLVDFDGIIRYVNPLASAQFGVPAEKIIGKRLAEVFPPHLAQRHLGVIRKIFETGEVYSGELLEKFPGGEVWIDARLSPVRNQEGKVVSVLGASLNITERKRVESSLKERDELLTGAQQIANLGSYTLDIADSRWTSSEILDNILGIGDDFPRDREGWNLLVHPEDREWLAEYLNSHVLKKKNAFNAQYRIVRYSDRQVRWVYGIGKLVLDEKGEVTRLLGTIQDVTEQKKVEASLRNSEQRYRTTLDSMGDMIHVVDRDLRILLANRAFAEFNRAHGLNSDMLGRTVFEVFPFLPAVVADEYKKVFESGRPLSTEETHRIDGREYNTETLKTPIFEGEKVTQVLTVIRDVTERKQAQKNQELMQKEILNALTKQQIMIGQTLHDSLGQLLTGVAYMVKGLEEDQKAGRPIYAEETARIVEYINQGIGQTKSLARMLYPAELERGGLPAALENLANQTRGIYNVGCSVRVEGDFQVRSDVLCTHLYRIAQEAVHNALSHGQATDIHIALAVRGAEGELSVADNGKGFDEKEAGEGKGLGLKILQYRAQEIGGSVFVRRNSPRGMIVGCQFKVE
ncbi:MAG TPA: PAS domain S-box protein [Elusimicrobiota bacterium]|nr:PAS domain S-box protein [Elusimicrobiota bacterium]